MTQISQNWKQLVWELNTWLVFGRILEHELVKYKYSPKGTRNEKAAGEG